MNSHANETNNETKAAAGRRRGHIELAIDKHVGQRVRERRRALGLSQERLGNALNISFQQVQKYENGKNRIGASRLKRIAETLQVGPGFFFDTDPTEPSPATRRSLEMVKRFNSLPADVQNGIAALVAHLARKAPLTESAENAQA